MHALGPGLLSVAENPGSCPICGGPMKVQKTTPRKGRSLAHGAFEAIETVHRCAARCRWPSGKQVARRAASLQRTLLPGSIVGYDVMVFVGLERFLRHRQREEIQAALMDHHSVSISTGEISDLSQRFVQYLARLHQCKAEGIRAVLEGDGGWPLHVDATGEAGRGTLLVAMAGWRQWVLGSWKISTERADLVLPCLREVIGRFGRPCAAVRDLGRAMIPALNELVSRLQQPIPVLACHQHFLADVGKDLLNPSHAQLRALFRQWKVRPHLRALVRELGRRIGQDIDAAREAACRWQNLTEHGHRIEAGLAGLAEVRALAQWILDAKAQASGLDFPFDRPYLDLYDRCIMALRACRAFLRNPPANRGVTAALRRLYRSLEPLDCKVPAHQVTERLRRRAALFDELRGVLRMSKSIPETETEQGLEQMREQLDTWVASLRLRRPARGPAQDMREAIDLILKHIETHGDNLWGHAIRLPRNKGVRLVARTNMVAENFFGTVKHEERRRSGRKNLGQDLENLPAEALLVQNLKHDDYIHTLCGSLQHLGRAFAEMDGDDRNKKNRRNERKKQESNLRRTLQLESSSLSAADRRIIRTDEMNHRIAAAAKSRAPKVMC
jgi:hypothetical protein